MVCLVVHLACRQQAAPEGASNLMKAALAVVGIGFLLALAPPAQASDDAQYSADLRAAGVAWQGSDQPLIDTGHTICQAIQGGMTPDAVAGTLANQAQLSVDNAKIIMGAAQKDLC